MRSVSLLITLALLFVPVSHAEQASPQKQPQIYGILVSASDYSKGGEFVLEDLPGARNDSRLMYDALIARGADPGNLWTHEAGYGAETLRALEAHILTLSQVANEGDLIVVHLTGHGLQIPDLKPVDEPDGLDEAFVLPGFSTGPATSNDHLITDDQIDSVLKRLLSTGAHVLFFADFCHAGDSARAGTTQSKSVSALPRDERPTDINSLTQNAIPRFTAIFAAPADKTALQSLGPVWMPRQEQTKASVLSMYAAAALANTTVTTFQDLQTEILSGFSAHRARIPSMRQLLAPPRFEGISQTPIPVLSASKNGGSQSFIFDKQQNDGTLRAFTFAYGLLTGVYPGDQFALYPVDLRSDDQAVAHFEIVSATATTSHAQLVDLNSGQRLEFVKLHSPSGRLMKHAARFQAKRVSSDRLRARPAKDFTRDAMALSSGEQQTIISDARAVKIYREADELWLKPDKQAEPIHIGSANNYNDLAAQIQDVWGFLSLVQDFESLRQRSGGGIDGSLSIELRRSEGSKNHQGTSCDVGDDFAETSDQALLQNSGTLSITGCDTVWITLRNDADEPRDISVIVVETSGQITPLPLFPTRQGNRIDSGQSRITGFQFDDASIAERAQIIIISVDVPDDAYEIISFDHLCRSPLNGTNEACPHESATSSGPSYRGSGTMFQPRQSNLQFIEVQIQNDEEADESG